MDFLVVKRAVRACEGLVHWNPGQVLDGASLIWDSANLPAPPAPNPHFPTSHVGNHPQQKVPPLCFVVAHWMYSMFYSPFSKSLARCLYIAAKSVLFFLLEWMCSPLMKGRKFNPQVSMVVGILMQCSMLSRFVQSVTSRTRRAILRVTPPLIAAIIWRGSCVSQSDRFHWRTFILTQWITIVNIPDSKVDGVMYAVLGIVSYLGSCGTRRWEKAGLRSSGGLLRLLEHIVGTLKPTERRGNEKRYGQWRAAGPWTLSWLVLWLGEMSTIELMERAAIPLLRLTGNEEWERTEERPFSRLKSKVLRRRPHRWFRQMRFKSMSCILLAGESVLVSLFQTSNGDMVESLRPPIQLQLPPPAQIYQSDEVICTRPALQQSLFQEKTVIPSTADLMSRSYADAHRIVCNLLRAKTGDRPRSLNPRLFPQLFALQLGTRTIRPHLEVFNDSDSEFAASIASTILTIESPGRKQLAKARFRPALQRFGLPLFGIRTFKCASKAILQAATGVVKTCLKAFAETAPAAAEWIGSRSLFLQGGAPKFENKRRHRRLARSFEWEQVSHLVDYPPTTEGVIDAIKNLGDDNRLYRVTVNSDTQCFLTWRDAKQATCRVIAEWTLFSQLPAYLVQSADLICDLLPPPSAQRAADRRMASDWQAYDSHASSFNIPQGCVLAQDDKDPKSSWRMGETMYRLLLVRFCMVSATWRLRTDITPQQAHIQVRDNLLSRLPSVILKGLRASILHAKNLIPQAYVSIKSKCWSEDGKGGFVQSCLKKGHQCCRVICATLSPGAMRFRSVSRAWQDLIVEGKGSFEAWSMRSAFTEVVRKRMRLRILPDGVPCIRCAGVRPKGGIACCAADADQFYETVNTRSVLAAAKKIRDNRGSDTRIAVLKVNRCRIWRTPGKARSPSFYSYTVGEVFQALEALVSSTVAVIGDQVIECSGLMIGAYPSKVCVSLYCNDFEATWQADAKLRKEGNWYLGYDDWSRVCANSRYTDDLFSESGILCGLCLEALQKDIYRGRISFTPQPTTGPQDWLDARFQQGSGDFDWHEREKTWRKPNVCSIAHKQTILRASVMAKFARINQVCFLKPALREFNKVSWFWRRVCTLLQDGYPKNLLKSIVISLPQIPGSPSGELLRSLISKL